MKPQIQLTKSRHGVFYLRYRTNLTETRISLKTRDPDIASLALVLARGMIPGMAKINKIDFNNIRSWTVRSQANSFEITTENNDQDRESALKALELLLSKGHTETKLNPNIFSVSPTITISKAVEEYEQYLGKTSGALKTKRMTMSVLHGLVKCVGEDFDMSGMTNQVVEAKWVDSLLGKVAETTIKRNLSFVRGFVKWASDDPRNYSAYPLTLAIDAEGNHWERFNADDLKVMFDQLPLLAETLWEFWVPIIGLYTGARISEICDLGPEMFEINNGIDALNLKGTKTKASVRTIPIHEDLVSIGLLKMVKEIKRNRGKKIFALKINAQNGPGAAMSKWFTNFKKRIGINHEFKVFHSFRTTIVDHMKQGNVPYSARCQYVGHDEGGGVHNKVYARNSLSLTNLKVEVTDKINWQNYCGWQPDIKTLQKKANELLNNYMANFKPGND